MWRVRLRVKEQRYRPFPSLQSKKPSFLPSRVVVRITTAGIVVGRAVGVGVIVAAIRVGVVVGVAIGRRAARTRVVAGTIVVALFPLAAWLIRSETGSTWEFVPEEVVV
jgi:hypothetical protein